MQPTFAASEAALVTSSIKMSLGHCPTLQEWVSGRMSEWEVDTKRKMGPPREWRRLARGHQTAAAVRKLQSLVLDPF